MICKTNAHQEEKFYSFIPELPRNLLTPKFGTGRSLICGPSLVEKSVREKEGLFKRFGRGACSRQFASVRQRECLR
jgi:hypothetical protein